MIYHIIQVVINSKDCSFVKPKSKLFSFILIILINMTVLASKKFYSELKETHASYD